MKNHQLPTPDKTEKRRKALFDKTPNKIEKRKKEIGYQGGHGSVKIPLTKLLVLQLVSSPEGAAWTRTSMPILVATTTKALALQLVSSTDGAPLVTTPTYPKGQVPL